MIPAVLSLGTSISWSVNWVNLLCRAAERLKKDSVC